MSRKSSLAIVVPCYNEETAIPVFKTEVSEFFDLIERHFASEIDLKFIFVDNNSTDKSRLLLAEFAAEFKKQNAIQVVSCQAQGYGAALKAGFLNAQTDLYGFADLDNTYPLKSFVPMITVLKEKSLDIVFANRLDLNEGMPLVRKLGNRFYSVLSKIIFKNSVTDMCTGMRLFTRAHRDKITSLTDNDLKFSIAFTATVLKENWKRTEISIAYRERLGQSKLSVVKDGVLFLYTLLKVRFSTQDS